MTLGARDLEAVLPLSPQQSGMLLEAAERAGSGMFLEQSVLAVTGGLDPPAFCRAWCRLVERHSILRTAFVWEDQERPLQVVLRRAEPRVALVDLRCLADDLRERALAAFLEADRRRDLDPRRPPLMRVTLVRLGEADHRLVWTVHHLALDGWCRTIVFEELSAFYRAARNGGETGLAPARPYGDYVEWLARQDPARAEAFWRGRLAGLAGPTTLPPAAGGPPAGVPRFGSAAARLAPGATAALRAVAARHRVTLGTVLQGALAILLSRCSGRDDVVFGVTVSGRPPDLPGVESIVGLFINTLPLRARVPAGGALWEWLGRLQTEALEMRRFEHCSAGQVHGWSGLPGSVPLYDGVLVFENYPPAEARADGLGLDVAGAEQRGARTRYLFTLIATARAELTLDLVYDGRRLAPADAALLLAHLERLLAGASAEPDVAELRAAIADGEVPRARPPAADPARRDHTPPRDAVEAALARLWAEALGLESVGIHESFLELGGHSLLATRLLDRVREALGREVPLRDLFAEPTVAGFARVLAASGEAAAGVPPALAPQPDLAHEPFPLFAIQRLYWLARGGAADVDAPGVNLYVELEVRGAGPDLAGRLAAAMGRLAGRHPMLRAVALPDGRQRVLPEVPACRVPVVDLTALPEPLAGERALALRDGMLHGRAPVHRAPLWELRLSRLAGGGQRLHARFEALLLDGDSRDRLLRELVGLAAGEPEPPACTYRDVALAWEELAASEAEPFRRSRRYWQERLTALPPPASLPSVLPEEVPFPRRVRPVRTTVQLLDRTAWADLKARAAASGATPSAVVAAAFARTLWRAGGQRSFCLAVLGSFRPPLHPDVERVIGNFDTLYPLPVADAALPLAELARRLQEETAAALEHRWASGVDLLLELCRRHGGPPVPRVFFNSLVEHAGGGGEGAAAEPPPPGPIEVVDYAITIPGLLLAATVAETRGGALLGLWQSLDGALPAGLPACVREEYGELLRRLAADEGAWRTEHGGARGSEGS